MFSEGRSVIIGRVRGVNPTAVSYARPAPASIGVLPDAGHLILISLASSKTAPGRTWRRFLSGLALGDSINRGILNVTHS